jgi:hypothetical protein
MRLMSKKKGEVQCRLNNFLFFVAKSKITISNPKILKVSQDLQPKTIQCPLIIPLHGSSILLRQHQRQRQRQPSHGKNHSRTLDRTPRQQARSSDFHQSSVTRLCNTSANRPHCSSVYDPQLTHTVCSAFASGNTSARTQVPSNQRHQGMFLLVGDCTQNL